MTSIVTRKNLLNLAGVLLLLLLVAPFVAYAVPQAIGATQSYVVLSGSMSPDIQTGDVIFVYETNAQELKEGDIITYNLNNQQDEVTTHRVVDVTESDNGETVYVTKGDANEDPDPYQVQPTDVIGEVPQQNGVPFHIPLLGRILIFAQSQNGLLLLVIIPAALLVVSELWDLYQEATKGGGSETESESSDSEPPAASSGESD